MYIRPMRQGWLRVPRNPDAGPNMKALRTCGIGSGVLRRGGPAFCLWPALLPQTKGAPKMYFLKCRKPNF